MKILTSVVFVACLICACTSNGPVIPHADSPASAPSAGPELCRDGSTPPCNDRD